MTLLHPGKPKRRGVEIPAWMTVLLLPVLVPLALLGCAISIPWTKIHFIRLRIKERKFSESMDRANRGISCAEAINAINRHQGVLLLEQGMPKGPSRFWWTPEDVLRASPFAVHHQLEKSPDTDAELDAAIPFFQWARERYTNPESGSAKLLLFGAAKGELSMEAVSKLPSIRILHGGFLDRSPENLKTESHQHEAKEHR